MPHKKVMVLDRDGVINQDSPEFIKTPDEFIPIPGSIEAIVRLGDAGFPVVIASNQSGVGRGLFNHKTLRSIHNKLIRLVEQAGGRLNAIYVCPHHPDAGCDCRKPKPGLLNRLAADLDVQPADLIVIGDSQRDLAAAAAVNARRVLVRTGNGRRTETALGGDSNIETFDDLKQAAAQLIDELS